MKHKILIADDSLTIQKVIKITLASEPFDLFECNESATLNSKLEEVKPDIVLLDFNLSEDKTGYDLSREIKDKYPNTKVLMLFGTFDTIEESLLEASGTNHKIVKPFDGTKFINLCRVMAEDFDIEKAESINSNEVDFSTQTPVADEVAMPEVIEEVEVTSEEDEWVMDSPHVEVEPEEEVIAEKSSVNPLEANMKDWGIDVPGVIGGASDHIEIPGVIENFDEKIEVESASVTEQTILPSGDDLAYPGEDDLAYPGEDDLAFPDEIKVESVKNKKKPELVPLDNLDEPAQELEVSEGGTDSDEALENLRAQIEDELEEDELWGADVYEEAEEVVEQNTVEIDDLPQVEPHNLHEVKDESDFSSFEEETIDQEAPEDFPSDVMDEEPFTSQALPEQVQPAASSVTHSFEIPSDLEEKLTPVVEEFVKEYCKEHIERIAWEVIPDLAENLIKKEIQKISEQILNS